MTDDYPFERAPGPAGQRCTVCGKHSSRYDGAERNPHEETCPHYDPKWGMKNQDAFVLDQNDIDKLLGFMKDMSRVGIESISEGNIIDYLRQDKCDLKAEAADLLEEAIQLLESRRVGSATWTKAAGEFVKRVKSPTLYD